MQGTVPPPGTYRDERYDTILFEEWEYDTYSGNLFQIRRLLERKTFVVDVKHEVPRVVRCSKPCIIISNEGTDRFDYPLVCTLTVVHAVNYALDNGFIEVPKDETDACGTQEEVETICLSSEEDVQKEDVPPS